MKIVYVAGPFHGKDHWEIAKNVRRAEELGLEVAKLGAMPLIPHTNTHNFHGTLEDVFWYEGTLELLRRCDAMVVLPDSGRSSGVRAELAFAKKHAIPTFERVEALARWLFDPGPVLSNMPISEAFKQPRMKRDANGDWVCDCGVINGSGMDACMCGKAAPSW